MPYQAGAANGPLVDSGTTVRELGKGCILRVGPWMSLTLDEEYLQAVSRLYIDRVGPKNKQNVTKATAWATRMKNWTV